jgi:hypothetical protein
MKKWSEMPDHARVWIYQSGRMLTPDESAWLSEAAGQFVAEWTSHGKSMDAAADVLHGLFLLIAADESGSSASGCGIDKSVRFVTDAGERLATDFLTRTNVAFMQDGEIRLAPMHAFWAMRKSGIVTAETPVFNNLVKTLGEWKEQWCVPFEKSWHQEMWGK